MLKVIDMWLGWAGSSLDPHEFSNFTEEGNKGVLKLHNQKKKKITDYSEFTKSTI